MLKIALEEHFDAPGIASEDYDGPIFAHFPPDFVKGIRGQLADIDDARLAASRILLANDLMFTLAAHLDKKAQSVLT